MFPGEASNAVSPGGMVGAQGLERGVMRNFVQPLQALQSSAHRVSSRECEFISFGVGSIFVLASDCHLHNGRSVLRWCAKGMAEQEMSQLMAEDQSKHIVVAPNHVAHQSLRDAHDGMTIRCRRESVQTHLLGSPFSVALSRDDSHVRRPGRVLLPRVSCRRSGEQLTKHRVDQVLIRRLLSECRCYKKENYQD